MKENEIINIPLETDSEHNYLFEITPLSYYYRILKTLLVSME